VLPPLPIMPPSHLHARLLCMPLGMSALSHPAFVCRLALFARARTHHPHHPTPPIAAAFCAFRILRIRIRIRMPPSSPRSPPRRSARDFTNHRGAASACFCRPLLTTGINKLASRKPSPSQRNARPSSSSSHKPHGTLPLTYHPFGVALHRAPPTCSARTVLAPHGAVCPGECPRQTAVLCQCASAVQRQ
jgi:hypothetical protein